MAKASSHAGAGKDYSFETEPFFSFHHANAYEADDGRRVVVDTVAMRSGFDFTASFDSVSTEYYNRTAGRGTLTRLIVDKYTNQVRLVLFLFLSRLYLALFCRKRWSKSQLAHWLSGRYQCMHLLQNAPWSCPVWRQLQWADPTAIHT